MPPETRTIGAPPNQFSTHLACKDDISNDYSGDITSEGDQTCETNEGGSDDIFSERVNWSGITCTAADRILLNNQNSFIKKTVATYRHGTILETTSSSYVHKMAEHMVIDGYTIIHKGNTGWGYGAVTPNNGAVLKNCFISAYAPGPGGAYSTGISMMNMTDVTLANLCLLGTAGRDYSIGIHCYRTTGTMNLDIFNISCFDLFAHNILSRNQLRVQGNSSLHVKVYNSFFEKPKGFSNACIYRSGGSEDLDMYNCITEDGSAYSGSGNLKNKKVWKDCYMTPRVPIIWDPASVAYMANYDLSTHAKREHFQNDIHGTRRDLSADKCCIGVSELVELGIYAPSTIRREAGKMYPQRFAGDMKPTTAKAGKMYPRR